MPTVLVVEDEEDIRRMIVDKLCAEGFDTLSADNGIEGLNLAVKHRPQLVVLDLMLPDRDGIAVCKDIRSHPKIRQIPIIILTARGETDIKIEGLEAGADDYLTKPFSVKELILRIQGILRRTQADGSSDIMVGPFQLDKNNLRLIVSGEEVDLTSTEFKLLLCLIEQPRIPRERGELLQSVWGYSNLSQTRTLDTHIKRLRAKLGPHGACIETVRSVGYCFNDSPEPTGDDTEL